MQTLVGWLPAEMLETVKTAELLVKQEKSSFLSIMIISSSFYNRIFAFWYCQNFCTVSFFYKILSTDIFITTIPTCSKLRKIGEKPF